MRRVLLKEKDLFTPVIKIAKKIKAPPQVVSWLAKRCPYTFQLDRQRVSRTSSPQLMIALRPGTRERMLEDPVYGKG
jgi:hypothetical protein